MFVHEKAGPEPTLNLPGVDLSLFVIDTGTSMFDLTLSVMESPESLGCSFTYNTDLFDGSTIGRISEQFQTLLEGIVADPAERLSTLPLLKKSERGRLLMQWNDTRVEYCPANCIHRLIEEQARRTPTAIAAVFEGEQLTYEELNSRANRLAGYLRRRGVGPEVVVGICLERSLEMIVALLAVLKAGGVYAPLDPQYPKERLAAMVEDSGAAVLITCQGALLRLSPADGDRRLMDASSQQLSAANERIDLDRDWNVIAQESEANPAVPMDAENLAYVIYTSGSSGRPKRVGVTHRSLLNYSQFAADLFELRSGERVLQFASFSFDTSAEEIFPCLVRGATLVLRSDGMVDSAASFLQRCSDWSVNVLDLPTAYWHELTEKMVAERLTLPACVRLVIIGGERAAPKQLMNWRRIVGDRPRLLNTYGPTEATVATTVWESCLTGSEEDSLREIPIGRPIANTQTYILDSHLEPVPIGVAGELYIGGAGLARGYLNQPDQTAEKFIPNPFNGRMGERLYRTGDLACYRADGNIEFVGRTDRQVKVRGYRIELGEIEAALAGHPQVRRAIVLAREDAVLVEHPSTVREDKRLVAYIVAAQGSPLFASELRNFLQATLPDYMIPSVFVAVESLPLTATGKIDYRALPKPDQGRPELEARFATPRSPVEEVLATIWADILGVGRVGIYDNFFDLGGHSLLATRVVSRVREVFGVEVPLRDLFERPSVAALAVRIDEIRRGHHGLQNVPMLPVSREGNLELSFAQQRLWFLDRFDPDNSVYNIPCALRLKGPLDIGALERSLNAIVARHESLRSTFRDIDGAPSQIIQREGSLSLPIIDLTDQLECDRESEAKRLTEEESRRPFDLGSDLMLRGKVLRLDARDHVLLLTLHHIAADGWSMGILYREISAFYEAFTTDKPVSLPELTIQYADFAHWQRHWLRGEVLQTQLSYWKAKLAELRVLELPTDCSRPPVQSYRGASESATLDGKTLQALRELSRKEQATLFMTLLAAFKVLLCRYTGQQDIAIGTPIAGRNRSEIEGLIGFFVNTLVLRTDLSGNCTFRELLRRVRETALGAYAHQDLPFEKLVEELQPERDLSRNPLFQIFFNMLHGGSTDLELPGLEIESVASFKSESKFDLTLYVGEHDDGARLIMVYNTDLFESGTIKRLLRHYCTLLEGVAVAPDRIVAHYPLLTQDERRELATQKHVVGSANAFVEFKREEIERSIAARFEQQATLLRDKTAVKNQEEQWTYGELNHRANQIARAILEKAGDQERVALLFEHEPAMIAAILGVLKSGKAYVPLEPGHPRERLSYMLEDSDSAVILSDRKNAQLARELSRSSRTVIDIDEIDPATSAENLALTVTPKALAYILYTSGSTGRPKGVMQNHRNVLHHIRCYTNSLHIRADDRLTLFSAYSHDAAVIDIFAALLNGATLYPWKVSEQGLNGLSEWLEGQEVTIYHSTPSLYQSLLDTLDSAVHFPKVRAVVLGGEKAANRHFEGFLGHFSPQAIFCNLYGSTESSFNLLFSSGAQAPPKWNAISIGYPVQDTEVVLLNEDGTVGELYGEIGIRSEHVALGYWRNPELTDAVFLPDPEQETRRLYRTGDIGRLLPDGSIGFLGRRDNQVKIRGYRIELGEIEAVLTQHPAVRQAVVVLRRGTNRPSSMQPRRGELLVGYVVMQPGEVFSVEKLRGHLKQSVPDYMVPAAFVALDSLPLMPNGKLDRRMLPPLEDQAPELETVYVAPRTPIEESLAEIWRKVLGLQRIGAMDNFFALGGHSLLAVQVIHRVGKQFDVEVPLRTLFEKPTIEQFAEVIFERLLVNKNKGHLESVLGEIEALSDDAARSAVGDKRTLAPA
jgi:amino acid adenylation domain-containing protein